MGFKDQAADEVKKANSNSNNNSNDREELETIDVDMANTPFIQFHPTTLVGGSLPADEGNPIILFKNYNRLNEDGFEAYNEEGDDLRYVSTRYLGIVIDDPYVITDEEDGLEESTFIETGDDDSTEFRAVNWADDNTVEKFNGAGISIDGNTYEIEDEATELEGRHILVVNRTAARSVAAKLDKNGATPAGMDPETGQVNNGLIEYPPDEVDAEPEGRYARPFVELRDDLHEDDVGFMVARRSEIDEEYAEMLEDDDDMNDMMWYTVFNMATGDSIEPIEGDPIVPSYLEWRFDADVGGDPLPEDQIEFVESYVETVEAGQNDADPDAIKQRIAANEANFDNEPNTDRIVELVQSRT